jgi:hypothetical protein
MARSEYVYVVMKSSPFGVGGRPVAAFTVKHELRSWTQKQASPEFLRFYRLPDNPRPSSPPMKEMTLKEVTSG